jgi:hypothetical protein
VRILAGARSDIVLEVLDQKTRGFLMLIALKRLISEHTHKLFGEISVRT